MLNAAPGSERRSLGEEAPEDAAGVPGRVAFVLAEDEELVFVERRYISCITSFILISILWVN